MLVFSCGALFADTFTTNVVMNAAIPDNSTLGLASRVEVPSNVGLVTNVRVSLVVTGGWNGDLYCYLSHGPQLAVLLNRVGRATDNTGGYGDHGFNATFDDGAPNGDVHVYRLALNGSQTPPLVGPLTNSWAPDGRAVPPHAALDTDPRTALLDAFQGASAGGAWTLFIADLQSFDHSTLVSWTLEVTAEAGGGYAAPPDVFTTADPGLC
jgi:subtilisin-like proprotein convertase family protein